MKRRSLLNAVVIAALGLASLGVAPPRASADSPVVILAATSLTESLQKVATAWTAKGHPSVQFSFDASSRLAKQVEAGAPVDAFFSADADWMDYLDGKGLIDKTTRANLVGNTLVAVLPTGSALPIRGAADLGLPGIQRLALAGESVPAGKYARAALGSLGAWDAVKDRTVTGDNVRTVLAWVARGEADAGVVYGTDAKVEPRVKVAFAFPQSSYPVIVYPMAVVKGASHAKDAAEFLAFCQSAAGMAVFRDAGFSVAPTAK